MSDYKSSIPDSARLVFKGKLYDVYQWEQVNFEGKKEIVEMLKRPNSVQAIPVVGDKILITEQQKPGGKSFLTVPGGKADGNEEPLETAKRELLEETGYSSEDWELWNVFNPQDKIDWTFYRFIARNCIRRQGMQLDGSEKVSFKFLSLDEFIALSENPLLRDKALIPSLLRIQLHPKEKETFRKLLFKTS